ALPKQMVNSRDQLPRERGVCPAWGDGNDRSRWARAPCMFALAPGARPNDRGEVPVGSNQQSPPGLTWTVTLGLGRSSYEVRLICFNFHYQRHTLRPTFA